MRSTTSLVVAALLGVCSMPLAAQQAGPSETPPQRVSVSGRVAAVNHFTGQVTIKTEEIPGLEGKDMTVAYMPKDTTALKALHEGDHVKGDLVISGSDTHMENVVTTGTTKDQSDKKKDTTSGS